MHSGMTTHIPAPRTSPTPVLHWVLQRESATITCELDVLSNGAYEVWVVPHWNVRGSQVERYSDPLGAFERHAELAATLRADGWTVVDHTHTNRAHAA